MIGVFDSGFGGLTILKHFLKELPEYDYLYLGDNARTPYGNRSTETLIGFSRQAVDYLFAKGCTLIIVACNTASSNVLRSLQEEYLRKPKVTDRKILGVIKPLAEEAARTSKNGRIGVVGTRSTINSKSYETELTSLNPDLKVFGQACPLLVPLIEENWYKKPETRMILKKYLRFLKGCDIDTLILGCTHYPFLYKDFCRMMGKRVQVLHPGEILAASLKNYLERHPEIETLLTRKGTRQYGTTDDGEKFQKMGSEFLGFALSNVEKISLN
jgi:glutamate racemase